MRMKQDQLARNLVLHLQQLVEPYTTGGEDVAAVGAGAVGGFRWRSDIVRAYNEAKQLLIEGERDCTAVEIFNMISPRFPGIKLKHVLKKFNKEQGQQEHLAVAVAEPAAPNFHQESLPQSKESQSKVVGLLYTKDGDGIIALGFDGFIRVWKWSNGKACAHLTPELWKPPKSGLQLMSNDVPNDMEAATLPCFSLSKNGYFLVSACGRNVSVFNVATFKVYYKPSQSP